MNSKDSRLDNQVLPSTAEEAAFELAFAELAARHTLRSGLWARALAEANGDVKQTEILYLRWRAEQILGAESAAERELPGIQNQAVDTFESPIHQPAITQKEVVSRTSGLLILVLMLVSVLGLLWIGGRSESSSSSLTVSASDGANAPVKGPAPVTANDSTDRSASESVSNDVISSLVASIVFPNDGQTLAAPYQQEAWHSCSVKMAKSLISWGGCDYTPKDSRCKPEWTSMNMSMLRRNQTPYGTEFTLHAKGVDPTGSVFANNYLCHLGRQNELISFKLLDL
jgi:hypothetical protein